jgi:DNA-directed RNA polymerase beta' subunit
MHVVDLVSQHGAAASDGSVLQDLLRAGGFESADLGSRRIRLFGQVSFLRGVRPL